MRKASKYSSTPPEVVDGAVAFIDDDEVEGLGGDRGIVATGRGSFGCRLRPS